MRTWSKEIFWFEGPDPEATQAEWRSLKRDPVGMVDISVHVRFLTRNSLHFGSRFRFPARDGASHLALLAARLIGLLRLLLHAALAAMAPPDWREEFIDLCRPAPPPMVGARTSTAPPLALRLVPRVRLLTV